MHNNFLVERAGKMSKSSGGFTTLKTLIDRGFHPLAYRLMCLQAHYRSELEFSWENLAAAQVRLKRLVMAVQATKAAAIGGPIEDPTKYCERIDEAVSDDLNTARILPTLEVMLANQGLSPASKLALIKNFDALLGLNLLHLTRENLRVRPVSTAIEASEIEARLTERREARTAKDFARSDAIRDELAAAGVEVMDGDPLGWDWKLALDR